MPAVAVDSVLLIPNERNLGLTFLLVFYLGVIRQSVLQETGFPSSIPHEAQRLRHNTISTASLIKKITGDKAFALRHQHQVRGVGKLKVARTQS